VIGGSGDWGWSRPEGVPAATPFSSGRIVFSIARIIFFSGSHIRRRLAAAREGYAEYLEHEVGNL
jgi:hypothetical protein